MLRKIRTAHTQLPLALLPPLFCVLTGFCTQTDVGAQTESAAPVIKGHLRKVEGVDLVFLSGTNAERGYAEGYLRAESVQAIMRGWVLKRVNPRVWDSVILRRIEKQFTFTARSRVRSTAMIEGMRARGTQYLVIPELKRDLRAMDLLAIPAMIDFAGIMCSSIAAWGDATSSHATIVCRNLDYGATPVMLEHQAIFIQPRDGDRRGWISIGWSSAWVLSGVSDAGVFLAIHDVTAHTHSKQKHLPRVCGLTEIIERLVPDAKTASRAGSILAEHRYAFGGNGMLAWSKGEIRGGAILEFGPHDDDDDGDTGVEIRRPDATDSVIACTNHHRLRREPLACPRYRILNQGLTQPDRAAFDADSLWELAQKVRKSNTLHTVLVDFGAGSLRVELRKRPHRDSWISLEEFDIAKLFAETRH